MRYCFKKSYCSFSIIFYKKNCYSFSVSQMKEIRKNFNKQICFKNKYKFLGLKNTPTKAIVNRITKYDRFLKNFKLLKHYFYNFFLKKKIQNIPIASSFLFFYNKYPSFKDLDRVLFWRYGVLDCIFSNKIKKIKKKKISTLIFITDYKRVILCINFLKYMILLNCKRRKKNMNMERFNPLYNFIVEDRKNLLIKIKYRIYRQKLMKLQY